MSAKETIVLFVHGANQGKITEAENRKFWENAFNVEQDNAQRLLPLINGDRNSQIAQYHMTKHPQSDFPAYQGWFSAWYGGVWASLSDDPDPFEPKRLNVSNDEDFQERIAIQEKVKNQLNRQLPIHEKIAREIMEQHFDELVPFYELAVIKKTQKTLYETICHQFLKNIKEATQRGQNYVLVGHSMGCAVTYNVMSHISCAKSGKPYCQIEGTLSEEYRKEIQDFASNPSQCFGLMTFGNYTGYDWCQRLNNRLLFGELKKQFVYPDAVGRWRNFWTILGGDPVVLDDILGDSMVDEEEDRYQDIMVLRIPGTEIGHERVTWFSRDSFVKRLCNQLEKHLYF